MDRKKSSASPRRTRRKRMATKGQLREEGAIRPDAAASLPGTPQTLALTGCPTTVFDGAILLNDAESEAFIRTPTGAFLLMLDPDCSGLFNPQRVVAAYQQFSLAPGRGGRLTCDGLLRQTGTTMVLHVVRIR